MLGAIIDKAPQSVLALGVNVMGAYYRLNRYSGQMRQTLNNWSVLEQLSLDEQQARQTIALRRILTVASTTPFYQKRFASVGFSPNDFKEPSDLHKLPVVTRQDLLESNDQMLVPNYPGRIIKRQSSGTTGQPVKFQQPRRLAFEYAYAALYQAYAWHGIGPLGRRATLAGRYLGVHPKGVVLQNIFENQLLLGVHAINKGNAEYYLDAIRNFKPQILQAHPSALLMLKELSVLLDLPPVSVPVIAFTGEGMSAIERSELMSWSNSDIFGQYGSGEHHLAAAECEHRDGYHINPEYSYTEIGRGADTGAIISTSLLNDVMPLIRYRIGDLADGIDSTRCSCGRTWPRLMNLRGREDDTLVLKGRKVPAVTIRTSLAAKFTRLPPYTVIRKKTGHISIELFSDESDADCSAIARHVSRILDDECPVECILRPSREQFSARGKRKLVVNE